MHKKKFLLLALLSMALAMATTSAFANTAAAGNEQNNLNFIGVESYGGAFPAEIVISPPNRGDSSYNTIAYNLQSNSLLSQITSSFSGNQNYLAANKLSDCGSNGGNYHAGKLSINATVTTISLTSANA